MYRLVVLRAVTPLPALKAAAHGRKGENTQQDEQDNGNEHDGFPFWEQLPSVAQHEPPVMQRMAGQCCFVDPFVRSFM